MKKNIFAILCLILVASGCDRNDENRIPVSAVRIEISLSQATNKNWFPLDNYGSIRYIKNSTTNIPEGFLYNVSSATGYGGILLVKGANPNEFYAYDLACPVERNPSVRIQANFPENASCPQCGSTYDIYNGTGSPLSGVARDKKYMLERYIVLNGQISGTYLITH